MGRLILEALFPRFCLGCGYVGEYVCVSCAKLLKRRKIETCFYCGGESYLGLTHPRCRRRYGVDGHISLYDYEGLFKKILKESKYKGAHEVLRELVKLSLTQKTSEIYSWKRIFSPIITAVPLHANRLIQRGFNQSELFANKLAQTYELEYASLLGRSKDTQHLANLISPTLRKKEIKNAFIYIGKVTPKTAIIIDDVITTGATVEECSNVMKRNGIQVVLTISLANG